MRNTFTRNTGILRENEWTVIIGDYVHSEMPYIGAVDCDGDFVDITQVVPGISLDADEIIMNHDLSATKNLSMIWSITSLHLKERYPLGHTGRRHTC